MSAEGWHALDAVTPSSASAAAKPAPDLGDCSAPSCDRTALNLCTYTDRRGRCCDTGWCADHRVTVLGQRYCRRHGSTVAALGGRDGIGGLPDLGDRSASLVYWVSAAVDDRIRALLLDIAPTGTTLLVDPVRLTLANSGFSRRHRRRWVRQWKLVSHTGVVRAVTVEVEETAPQDVTARVDAQLVGRGVPPWIAFRGTPAAIGSAKSERAGYYSAICHSVAKHLATPGPAGEAVAELSAAS